MDILLSKRLLVRLTATGLAMAIATSALAADPSQADKKAAMQKNKKEVIENRKELLQDKKELQHDIKQLNKLQKEFDGATKRHANKQELDQLKNQISELEKELQADRNGIAKGKVELVQDKKALRNEVVEYNQAVKNQKANP